LPSEKRRRHPRIYRPVKVNYSFEEELFTKPTMSLSMGGMYLKTVRPLEIGSIFPLDFTLPDFDHDFQIKGKVIWNKITEDEHGPPGMGIKFIDAREDDKKALLQYLGFSQMTQRGY
jgi:uncharacterized protein (TIGR02266 family)